MEQGKQVLENVFFRKAAQNCTKIGENIKKRTVSLQSDFSWGMGVWKDTFQLSQLESQVLVQYLWKPCLESKDTSPAGAGERWDPLPMLWLGSHLNFSWCSVGLADIPCGDRSLLWPLLL